MDSYGELSFQNATNLLPIDVHLVGKSNDDIVCDEGNTSFKMTFSSIKLEDDAAAIGDAKVSFGDVVHEVSNLPQNTFFYIKENSPAIQIIHQTSLPILDGTYVNIPEIDTTKGLISEGLVEVKTLKDISTNEGIIETINQIGVSYEVDNAIASILQEDIETPREEVTNLPNEVQETEDDTTNKKKLLNTNSNVNKNSSPKGKTVKKNKSEAQYECEVCRKKFREKSHLATHSRAHVDVRNFSCNICGLRFKTKANLFFHSQTHSESPFTCTECNKTFAERKILKRHIRVVHSNKELHKCNQCDKTFKSATNLSLHYSLHTGSKPFRCQLCPKSFVYKSTLSMHVNQNHQCSTCLPSTCRHRSRPWLCPSCGKGYSLKATLNNHMRIHDPDKLFKCNECSKTFVKKQSYETHMKLHAGEGPQYMCDQCSQSYFNVFALRRHYMKHTSQRNFICDICSKAFWMKDALKVHMRSHLNIKPFQCQKCPKAFAHKHTLEGHMKTHRSEAEKQRDSKKDVDLFISSSPSAIHDTSSSSSTGTFSFQTYSLPEPLQPAATNITLKHSDQNMQEDLQVL